MLTIWLDPGRIKRGLQPNEQLGAPLRQGEHYTLIVSKQWEDIQGSALSKPYLKKFITATHDSLGPNPKTWIIDAPKSFTRNSLFINLNSSLDYGLLTTALHVIDESGKNVFGDWQIGDEEKTLSFIPDEPWANGNYQLQIETRLEDLAGNNLNRPFDVDIRAKTKQVSDDKVVSIPFKVAEINN
jgi:hypothetical protein